MLGTTQQTTKYYKIIEMILFMGLCILLAYFMWGVLDKYFSHQTSFNQSEEPINKYPTFTFCLFDPGSYKHYEYGTDFQIIYGIWEGNSSFHHMVCYLAHLAYAIFQIWQAKLVG